MPELVNQSLNKTSACVICGSHEKWEIPCKKPPHVVKALKDHGLEADYHWCLCKHCGNAYQIPPSAPEILAQLWAIHRGIPSHNQKDTEDVREARTTALQKSTRTIFDMISPLLPEKGSMLDIGCGPGYLVKLFTERGWKAMGIDPDPTMKPLHDTLGIDTTIGQVESLNIGGQLDAIFCDYAIYFITQPMQFLTRIKPHIKSGGFLCLVLANFFTAIDRGLPDYLHTFLPSKESMEYALALAGYEVRMSRKYRTSIYIVAVPSPGGLVELPKVNTRKIYWTYRTKEIRYQILGRPILALREIMRRVRR